MSKSIFLVLFLSFSSALSYAEPLAPADVKALLGRIREKRASAPQVQADFQEEKTIKLMNKPVSSSGKVWFQAPNKFRREVKGNSPSVTVSDGQQLWIYYPKFKSAESYQLGKRSPLDAGIAALTASLNLQGVESSYQITGSQEGGAHVLQLVPRTPSMKRMLWCSATSKVPSGLTAMSTSNRSQTILFSAAWRDGASTAKRPAKSTPTISIQIQRCRVNILPPVG
jgi:outer membrane lipoprotein-sorting protein